MERTSDTLNKAADLVQEYGWTQGAWGIAYNGAPVLPLCVEGALLAAAGLGGKWWDENRAGTRSTILDACPAAQAVRGYLDYDDIADWNDEPGRTAAEVIEVLRAAALIEASRESQDAAFATCAQNVVAS